MDDRHYYVTTSIPYVNARPHLGHALELVQADVLARFHRQRGDDTRFLTGTDDNSLKNVQAAEAAGLPTQTLVDRNAAHFHALRDTLNLSFDDFIRTSGNPAHAAGARRLWHACAGAGDIYKRAYRGLYCVGCEAFYTPDELVDDLCPEHLRPPELVEEENWFFRLSHYATPLHDAIATGRLRIVPRTRQAEVLRFIERGLADFSISRSQARAHGWGIPVPDDPGQVMYVWWDALINYITALGYGDGPDSPLYTRYWRDNSQRVHVIGKGILRFHAVYWPAMLISAGEPLPTTLYVHEYLTVDGQTISKSLGNAIGPDDLVARFGTDALRYWFLRDAARTEDTDFTTARLSERYNADLANGLGNLLQRTISMIARWRAGIVPAPGPAGTPEQRLAALAANLPDQIATALDEFDFRAALGALWALVASANRYVEESAPWQLARRAATGDRSASQQLDTALYTLAETLHVIASHLAPFLPSTSQRITAQLGLADPTACCHEPIRWGLLPPGTHVAAPQPLFPRLE
ncbi:MAG: methionine--tRNA ligase [Thermomicrobiales bacterium]